MHFNLDNKEYSLTLENREKKTKKQKSGLRYALPATALFATQLDYLRVLVCWSEAKHLYQDKHTSKCHFIKFLKKCYIFATISKIVCYNAIIMFKVWELACF